MSPMIGRENGVTGGIQVLRNLIVATRVFAHSMRYMNYRAGRWEIPRPRGDAMTITRREIDLLH
ncbi:MAG: hypothetical protein ACO3P1_14295 [Pseudomonadales bacterium]